MSTFVSRRTLINGAAWSAPIIAASATVPAYAASPRDYNFTASWFSEYETTNEQYMCSYGSGYADNFTFHTDGSYDGEAPGFGVTEVGGSPHHRSYLQ